MRKLKMLPARRSRGLGFVLAAAIALLSSLSSPLLAQVAVHFDVRSDAQDARDDALLATPSLATPQPLSNLYATAPGLEQQVSAPQGRFNLLLPFAYNSNAEEIAHGGTQTLQTFPAGNLSWAVAAGSLPLRITFNSNAESDRYFRAPAEDLDTYGASGRIQYVDSTNDQAFSPYFAFAPRWDYLPTFSEQISARQDFNLGFNKRYNFDSSFQPVPIASDTSASSVWSFGLTAFVQRRLREPQVSSSAVFVVPSVSCVISKDWNASLGVEFLGRWYDPNSVGFSVQDWEVLPVATVEYVIPTSLFGSEMIANAFGRPALDFQASYLRVWSNPMDASFGQFAASATIKAGWRF